MTSENSAVAIFAGGQSERMGQDKALLKIEGQTLLERMAQIALEVSPRVYIVGRAAPENWHFDAQFLPDDVPHLGPIGALQTVLKREKIVLALACDLPKMTSDGLRWLLAQQSGANALFQTAPCGVIVKNNDQLEPLFSIYTEACLPLIEENIEAERRSLHGLIKKGNFTFAKAPPEIRAQLVNVNTPQEWRAVKTATTVKTTAKQL